MEDEELYTEENDIFEITEEELLTVDEDKDPETSMWS